MAQYLQLYKEKGFTNEFFDEDERTNLHYFGEIKDINLLIGANNSRKSRFLRKLLKKETIILSSDKLSKKIDKLKSASEKLIDHIQNNNQLKKVFEFSPNANKDKIEFLRTNFDKGDLYADILSTFDKGKSIVINVVFFQDIVNDLVRIISEGNNSTLTEFIKRKLYPLQFLKRYITNPLEAQAANTYININHPAPNLEILGELQLDQIISILEYFIHINIKSIPPLDLYKFYIPTLRTAVNLYSDENSKIQNDIYKLTVEKHYELKDDLQLKIHTGLNLYKQIKVSRNSEREEREKFKTFEQFLQDNFFQGESVEIIAIINSQNRDKEHISIDISGNENNIYDVGDGIQALIVLLYPIFMAKEGSWFFIEEPELNMHPGLQNIFLKTLLTEPYIRKKKLKYFITTHSNHLLYQSLLHADQVSVFSFKNVPAEQKNRTNIRRIKSSDPEVLDLLGVYNVSVLMANCCIWVEGISDRKYLMAFLTAYIRAKEKQNYIEGLHYAFFEYAGSNIRHYNFGNDEDEFKKIKAHLLSNKIFLLADRDSGEHKKEFHKRLKQLNNKNHFQFMTTTVVEIENVLSDKILKKFLIEGLKKDKNKVEAHTFQSKDYKDEHLGNYLTKFKNLNLPDSLKEKSGTLTTYYKNKLSQFVLEKVESGNIGWDDIKENRYAKKLTEAVYSFITKHNQ